MLEAFDIRMSPHLGLAGDMRKTDLIIYMDTQKHGGNVTDFVGDEFARIPFPCQAASSCGNAARVGLSDYGQDISSESAWHFRSSAFCLLMSSMALASSAKIFISYWILLSSGSSG